jgi:predicted DNA-binding protein with PD1-like motif
MRGKLIAEDGEKTYALIFATGDEAAAGLLDFAKEERLAGSHFTAIGGFSRAILGYFDPNRKEYKKIPIDEQVEVLSGRRHRGQGRRADCPRPRRRRQKRRHGVGGHLIEGHVRPTLEVMLVESPAHLQRQYDPETGLTMIQL